MLLTPPCDSCPLRFSTCTAQDLMIFVLPVRIPSARHSVPSPGSSSCMINKDVAPYSSGDWVWSRGARPPPPTDTAHVMQWAIKVRVKNTARHKVRQ
jgi:hypothetical protein